MSLDASSLCCGEDTKRAGASNKAKKGLSLF